MFCKKFLGSFFLVPVLFCFPSWCQTDTKSGLSLRQAQEVLHSKGYLEGTVDGKYGPKTRAALTKYQKEQGLPETGRLDAATANKLSSEATPTTADTSAGAAKQPAATSTKGRSDSIKGAANEATSVATTPKGDGVKAATKEATSSAESEGKSALKEMKGVFGGKKKEK